MTTGAWARSERLIGDSYSAAQTAFGVGGSSFSAIVAADHSIGDLPEPVAQPPRELKPALGMGKVEKCGSAARTEERFCDITDNDTTILP